MSNCYNWTLKLDLIETSWFDYQTQNAVIWQYIICCPKFCLAQIFISVLWKTVYIRLSHGLCSQVSIRRPARLTTYSQQLSSSWKSCQVSTLIKSSDKAYISSWCPVGSTDQACSSGFNFRITWKLSEQPCFLQNHSLSFLLGLRSSNVK